ncbi:MAG: transcriptional regulator [Bacteriovoracaceae bacterium]|nr:transcriptional regulator [Bacteriovoracaceae bacterium]
MPRIKPIQSEVQPPVDDCPMKRALQFISGAWTPEIVWYLQNGPRRFRDLQRDLDGVSSKVLTQRLKELEENGILDRKVFPTKPPTVEYSLTELGRRFQPVLDSIAQMGRYLVKQKKFCPRGESKQNHSGLA